MTRSLTRDSLRARAADLSPDKLAHVVASTDRWDEMRSWYQRVLNATVAFENDSLSFLRYDDEHHRIGIIRLPEGETLAEGVRRIDHISFTYAELAHLLGTYLRLRDHGIEPFWTINHGPTVSMYYKDPDGNHIELQIDTFDDDELEAFFAGGAYERNPIGVNFDPEDYIERYLAGEPVHSITTRPELPAGVSPFDMIPS